MVLEHLRESESLRRKHKLNSRMRCPLQMHNGLTSKFDDSTLYGILECTLKIPCVMIFIFLFRCASVQSPSGCTWLDLIFLKNTRIRLVKHWCLNTLWTFFYAQFKAKFLVVLQVLWAIRKQIITFILQSWHRPMIDYYPASASCNVTTNLAFNYSKTVVIWVLFNIK